MVRLAFRGAVGVLAAALATACLGGQTGQPTSGHCDSSTVTATDAWSGTTVGAAVRAFEGTQGASLRWYSEARSAAESAPVEFADNVQLTISYHGDSASLGCTNDLRVPVSIQVTTSNSGVVEEGPVTLWISQTSQGLVGSLHYQSKLISLDATLDEAARATTPQGSLDALDGTLPGASARFPGE